MFAPAEAECCKLIFGVPDVQMEESVPCCCRLWAGDAQQGKIQKVSFMKTAHGLRFRVNESTNTERKLPKLKPQTDDVDFNGIN